MVIKAEKINDVYKFSWKIFTLIKEMWDETEESIINEKNSEYLNLRVDLLKKIREIPNIEDNISYYDTNDFFYEITTRLEKDYHEISFNEFTKYVDHYLIGKPFTFEFCFRYGKTQVFPSGYKLGYGMMYPFDDLPPSIKKRVEWAMMSDFYDNKEYKNTYEEYKKHRIKNDNYMYLEVKALGFDKAVSKAISLSNRSSNILKFVNHFKQFSTLHDFSALSHFNYYANCDILKKGQSQRGSSFGGLPVHRWEVLEYLTQPITEMMLKQKPTEIEKRILNMVDVYGMIDDSTPLHLSFLLCIISLEGLYLHDGDKDYLGWKLSEKISFLLGDTKTWYMNLYNINNPHEITSSLIQDNIVELRVKLSQKVIKLYNKRSKFAHVGLVPRSETEKISEDDYNEAFQILHWSISKFIELSKNGIEFIQKNDKNPHKSLDELIEKIKFGMKLQNHSTV